MSQVSLIKGYIFAERYQIVRRMASGGMGAVYEVTHLETNRRRALKVMHAHTLQSEEMRERFRNEARVAAKIESEHIVDVFDAGVDAETQMPFLVMELLRGEDLGKLLRKRKQFEPREVLTYLRQVASALDKTHRANVVHRDLKPDNLFLTEREDGTPWIKVLDFGIAKVIEELTEQGGTAMVGTPLYMAPEQFQRNYAVTPATDLYSLGMVAYTLLVGFPYWREESRRSEGNVFLFASDVMRGPSEAAGARARRAGVELPEGFDGWFAKATAFAPRARFQTAGDMAAALAVALGLGQSMAGPGGETTMPTILLSNVEVQSVQSVAQAPTMDPQVTTKAPSIRRGRRWVLGVVAAGGVVALGATGVALLGRPGAAAEEGEQATVNAMAPAAEAEAPPPQPQPEPQPQPKQQPEPQPQPQQQPQREPQQQPQPTTTQPPPPPPPPRKQSSDSKITDDDLFGN